jgi:DNA-binding transcriptional MerR regulator
MTYTVKQLADLAGVTARTLHYYDEIGLLPPSGVAENGYRRYDDAAALRLQQILFYRELGLNLNDIREALDQPDFDVIGALRLHREALQSRVGRLNHLIHTIDRTLLHLEGQIEMSTKDMFEGFDEETQARYEQEAAERYDPKVVAESSRRWKSYTAEDKARIMAEGGAIYRELATMIGRDPADAEVQAAVARWHQHLRAFYEPTPGTLRGLGAAYEDQPEFAAFYKAIHPDLPPFLHRAIDVYVDSLRAAGASSE